MTRIYLFINMEEKAKLSVFFLISSSLDVFLELKKDYAICLSKIMV